VLSIPVDSGEQVEFSRRVRIAEPNAVLVVDGTFSQRPELPFGGTLRSSWIQMKLSPDTAESHARTQRLYLTDCPDSGTTSLLHHGPEQSFGNPNFTAASLMRQNPIGTRILMAKLLPCYVEAVARFQ
jgi:hypothetical protein